MIIEITAEKMRKAFLVILMIAVACGAVYGGFIVAKKWKAYALLPDKYEYVCVDGIEYFIRGHAIIPHYRTTSGELYSCTSESSQAPKNGNLYIDIDSLTSPNPIAPR